MKTPETRFGRLLSLSFSALVFCFCLEIGARLDDTISYGANFLDDYSDELLYAYDEDGLRHNVPNSRYEKWQNNSHGFRGDEFSKEKPSGVFRIACMGTSETYGLYEAAGHEWPARLAELLDTRSDIQVFNASTVGLATQQYARYMDKYVLPFEPDLIVILANPQNFFSRLERKARREQVETNKFQAEHIEAEVKLAGLSMHLRVLGKTRQMIKRFLPQSWVAKYQLWDREKLIADAESRYLRGEPPLDRIPAEYVSIYKADLEAMVAGLQSKGIEVVLCSYPTLMAANNLEEHRSTFLESRRFFVELSFAGMMDATRQCDSVTHLVADSLGAGFIDASARMPKTSEFFSDNVHFSDQGADRFAHLVSEYLSNQSYFLR